MVILHLGRRHDAYHIEVNTRGQQSRPHAATLRPEGAMQRQRVGQGDGGEDLMTVARTACHAHYGRSGDAAAARGSVQPQERSVADILGAAVDRRPRHYGPNRLSRCLIGG